ncbi:MAG TPA: hypothetical protein PKW60_06655 [Candidatus Hydrogenedentes bacterium]|nr:hypothetical protein [Candidatus Hydrogenedentota bacterium]
MMMGMGVELNARDYTANSCQASLSVCVFGPEPDIRKIPELGARAQNRYDFCLSRDLRSLTMQITSDEEPALFSLRDTGVAVSAWQSEGIARYAGIDRTAYFLLCGALGLLQYRALALNPLLQPDDFLHGADCGCLFSTCHAKHEYALLLEQPRICGGCVQFFDCLGCEPEVGALLDVIGFIHNSQPSAVSSN